MRHAKWRTPSIIGKRFGRLLVLEETVSRRSPGGVWRRQFRVRCDCGTEAVVGQDNLRAGLTKSCGCIQRQITAARSWKHGDAQRGKLTTEYNIRCAMLQRCYNPNCAAYPDYGGRGIEVCGRWRLGENGKTGFECFLADVGRRPSSRYTLDRIDNDGNYDPSNCRWATRSEQRRNQRRGVILVQVGNEELPLTEACKRRGVSYKTAKSRLLAGRPFDEPSKPGPKPRAAA